MSIELYNKLSALLDKMEALVSSAILQLDNLENGATL